MIRRLIVTAGLLLAFAVALGGPVSAQYVDSATVDNPSPHPGQTVVVSGTCTAGVSVVVKLDDGTVLASGTVAADGTFSLNVTIPPGTSIGPHTLDVFCDGAKIASLPINVTADPTTGTTGSTTGTTGGTTTTGSTTGPLARTGTDFAPVLSIGAVLLAGGGLILLATRKRRSGDTTA